MEFNLRPCRQHLPITHCGGGDGGHTRESQGQGRGGR